MVTTKATDLARLIKASGKPLVRIAADAGVSERTVIRARDGGKVLPVVESAIRAVLASPPQS